ncbi:MAG: ETC complex I subunit [Rhodospirillaceae bacterium]|nr:ETC complex I subunit [Rhodospirillaceae bacterium]MBT5244367.1 ETC complex I subunit [Rhodospirillaceae bacterium]MBT5563728.1 ETC complex I subunit [Rhodospirillaceae bacterium]MBT6241558.1 ETC complex I subunit [Rhodospirillaceae bacterium]
MSQVRIYQPTKNAMQSGRAKLGGWVLEHEPGAAKRADPLMGWIGSDDDTKGQVCLRFETRDEAVAFAKINDLDYSVTEPKVRRVKPKDYSANFAYDRIR